MNGSLPVRGYTFLGVALALFAPGAVALLADRYWGAARPLAIRSLGLLTFIILLVAVGVIAIHGERLTWSEVGFGRVSWASLGWAVGLTCFFVFGFGPVATAVLTRLGLGSFAAGTATLASLPAWYLVLTIVIVAGGEEWLYRGYAIERLTSIVGNFWVAGGISVLAFGLAHLPMWGPGPSLTTLFSGGIVTVLYIWRRDVTALMLAHIATDIYGLVVVS